MADIFISYASPDRETARLLAERLAERGHSVWWDRTIPPGRVFDEVIQEALNAAKCVIVLWSASSVRSNWVKTEAGEALSRNNLVPVLIENVPPPIEFKRIQAASLAGWKGDADYPEFRNLLASVERLLEQPTSPLPAFAPGAFKESAPPHSSRALRRIAIAIGAAVILAAGAWGYLRNRHEGDVSANVTPATQPATPAPATPTSQPPAVANPPPAVAAAPSAAAPPAAAAPAAAATRGSGVNLLSAENGGEMLTATAQSWSLTVDGNENTYAYVEKGEAVFGFKDGRAATFDTVAVLIPSRQDYNVRQFELLAGNDGPLGRFQSIGVFTTQNIRMMKEPFQAFQFAPVTAKFIKIRPLAAHAANTSILVYEWQLLGTLD